MNFVAIDFETATSHKNSACAVGIVDVKNRQVVEKYYALIQPPGNTYYFHNSRIHGIVAKDTKEQPSFEQVFPQIQRLLTGKEIVAHNEQFDREVLQACMLDTGLNYKTLNIKNKWHDTVKIFKRRGEFPVNLAACSARHGIELKHHNALSDALACAKLFLIYHSPLFVVK